MKVQVIYASRYGSTREIAEAIGKELEGARHEVSVASVDAAPAIGEAGAVVLGSAVYMGRWLKTAREFVDDHSDELAGKPLWLFSSGPIGEPPKPEEQPENVAAAMEATGAREHAVFSGKIDPEALSRRERLVVRALKVQTGDFRDWDGIRDWASSVARALR